MRVNKEFLSYFNCISYIQEPRRKTAYDKWMNTKTKKAQIKLLEMIKTMSRRKTALGVITAYEPLQEKMINELEYMTNKNISLKL